jgi:SpoU rRNA methylase family enzyme
MGGLLASLVEQRVLCCVVQEEEVEKQTKLTKYRQEVLNDLEEELERLRGRAKSAEEAKDEARKSLSPLQQEAANRKVRVLVRECGS